MTVPQFFALILLDLIMFVTFVAAVFVAAVLISDARRARRVNRTVRKDLPKVLADAEKLLRR